MVSEKFLGMHSQRVRDAIRPCSCDISTRKASLVLSTLRGIICLHSLASGESNHGGQGNGIQSGLSGLCSSTPQLTETLAPNTAK